MLSHLCVIQVLKYANPSENIVKTFVDTSSQQPTLQSIFLYVELLKEYLVGVGTRGHVGGDKTCWVGFNSLAHIF